jgi:hypothetical protein
VNTYQGSDWDSDDGNPPVGTVITKGQGVGLVLYSHAGAVDALGIRPTDYTGNLGMSIVQDTGAITPRRFCPTAPST